MIDFSPHINVDYPPNNEIIFEEWFKMCYTGCNTDRELLPVLFTPFWVNNNYGQDKESRRELNDFLGTLDKSKKYFTIIQYDDGSMIDWRLFGLDVLEFNMSKQNGVMIPLICMPHPYKFSGEKKYVANFIGSRTHPIRNELEKFKYKDGWYISYEQHSIEKYCEIISQSIFTLCPRGYGASSFRICEALQYGSVPIYISDEWIVPFNNDFFYGMRCLPSDDIVASLEHIRDWKISQWYMSGSRAYDEYYTYHGCYKNIIKELEAEYNLREQNRKKAELDRDAEESGAWRF